MDHSTTPFSPIQLDTVRVRYPRSPLEEPTAPHHGLPMLTAALTQHIEAALGGGSATRGAPSRSVAASLVMTTPAFVSHPARRRG